MVKQVFDHASFSQKNSEKIQLNFVDNVDSLRAAGRLSMNLMKILSVMALIALFCSNCDSTSNVTKTEDGRETSSKLSHDCVQPKMIETLKDGLSHIYQFKYGKVLCYVLEQFVFIALSPSSHTNEIYLLF